MGTIIEGFPIDPIVEKIWGKCIELGLNCNETDAYQIREAVYEGFKEKYSDDHIKKSFRKGSNTVTGYAVKDSETKEFREVIDLDSAVNTFNKLLDIK